MFIPQRAPIRSQCLKVERLSLPQLALVTQQKLQVAEGAQLVRALITQHALLFSQCLKIRRLHPTQLALWGWLAA